MRVARGGSGAKAPLLAARPLFLLIFLPKLHHRPYTLYVPTGFNNPLVDGLARIFGLTQALYTSHPQPPDMSRDPPRPISLSANTQGSLVPSAQALKGVWVRERERG